MYTIDEFKQRHPELKKDERYHFYLLLEVVSFFAVIVALAFASMIAFVSFNNLSISHSSPIYAFFGDGAGGIISFVFLASMATGLLSRALRKKRLA